MKDYRELHNRPELFDKLYEINLRHNIMPGLVYLYMPALARHYAWDEEQKLWFAFLNGMTQNPITSLQMFKHQPQVPTAPHEVIDFERWFNYHWELLRFDTDRRHQKKDTTKAIDDYARKVYVAGSQKALLDPFFTYNQLWEVASNFYSFGRLSTFSYLEYLYIMGAGKDCDDLMFGNKSGSRSHRNGMLMLLGHDELVWDKRANNGFNGDYPNFDKMCGYLSNKANLYVTDFMLKHKDLEHVGYFTFESQLCTFKNHFFGRRYPGVYADMAWDRIVKADKLGLEEFTEPFKEFRKTLPDWLRCELDSGFPGITTAAGRFPETGAPYRAEHFLGV